METERNILHIDFDSFFASVEQQANPLLRGKPIGVTGSSLTKGVVCAASIEAKKYGVKTGMPLFEARKLCPNIIPVKGDFTKYKYIHEESLKIFNKYTNLVEPFSIDEAFIDVTNTIKLFQSPENIAFLIKKDVFERFGPYITCSIGIGPNKLMAKLVSDFNKPNGLFRVTKNNMNEVLRSVKLTDFCGIGPRINARLNSIGILNTAQLQDIDMETLYKEFGNLESRFLKNVSFGIGDIEINKVSLRVKNIEYNPEAKSIGHQHTLSKNTSDIGEIKSNLYRLSDMVGRRLRNQKLMGKTISIYLRDSDFKGFLQRTTVKEHTDNSWKIFRTAVKLLNEMGWNRNTRLVGVSISNLMQKYNATIPIFGKEQRVNDLISAADKINDKFGEFTLFPADTISADQTKGLPVYLRRQAQSGKISSFLRH